MAGIEEKYKNWTNIEKAPETQKDKAGDFDANADKAKLQDFMAHWMNQYNDLTGIVPARAKDGKKVDPPESCLNADGNLGVWYTIAANIVNRYHGDRNGKAIPKGKGGASFEVGLPPAGYIPGDTTATAVLNGDKKFPGDKNTVGLIVKWFKANYDAAQQAGIDAKSVSFRNSANFDKAINITEKSVKKEGGKIDKKFKDYWKGKQFGVGGGVPLPAVAQPKTRDQEYFPNLAPHKDAELTDEGNPSRPDTDPRKGPIGWVIGPVSRDIQTEEIEGETTKLRDGSVEYELPVFRSVAAPIDKNQQILDSPEYESILKTIPGYPNYRKLEPEFTGLPVDGKELKIPVFPDNPDNIRFDENDNPIPDRELSADPKEYNPGIGADGKIGKGLGYQGKKDNPNYDKPIDNPAYGALICTEFPFNTTETQEGEFGLVDQWKKNASQNVLQGNSLGAMWGAGNSKGGNKYITFQQPYLKEDSPTEVDGKTLSYSDPRTWGPYEENTKHTSPDNSVGEGGVEKVDGKNVTYTVKWKYVYPSGLASMKSAANTSLLNQGLNGVPPNGTTACIPEMNKQYWGLRLREVYPEPLDPFEQATKPVTPSPSAAVVNGTGGCRKGAKYAAGPAPPFTIKEKSSDFKWYDNNFPWKHAKLFSDGALKPQTLTSKDKFAFGRDDFAKKGKFNDTIKGYIQAFPKQLAKVIDFDGKVKGKASGGMLYFDAQKQIIPPYAPPPLKPFIPSNEKFEFSGVK